MMEIALCLAVKHDIDEIYALEKACFAEPWPKETFVSDLSGGRVLMLCARKGGSAGPLAGYGQMNFYYDEAHITSIAVAEDSRRQGIASRLMEAMLLRAHDYYLVTLEVRVSNTAAIRLYEKFGFEIVYKRSKYYSDNKEDAYVMDWRGGHTR